MYCMYVLYVGEKVCILIFTYIYMLESVLVFSINARLVGLRLHVTLDLGSNLI